MSQDIPINILLSLDVGESQHHTYTLGKDGIKVFDKPLPQLESELAALFEDFQTHGTVLVVVDQPNTIGARPIAVAHQHGCQVGYLPGLAIPKAANTYPEQAKTDRRDTFIIADTARTMPHTLRAVDPNNEVLSTLKMLSSFMTAPEPSNGYAVYSPKSTPAWGMFSLAANIKSTKGPARNYRRPGRGHAGGFPFFQGLE